MSTLGQVMESKPMQPLRPLLHMIAYYPLLLAVPVVLLLFAWDVLMGDYDAFHQLWNEDWLTGILAGFVAAVVLGQTMLAVYLFDEDRGNPAAAKRWRWAIVPRWGYWIAWGLLLAAMVLPAAVLSSQFAALDENHTKAELARLWFPLGVLAAIIFFGLLRATRASWFVHPEKVGGVVAAVIVAGFLGMTIAHGVWPEMYCPWFPAAVSLVLLLGFITILLTLFTYLTGRTPLLYPALIGVFIVPFLIPSCQTEYQLPNMQVTGESGTYYDKRFPLVNYASVRPTPPPTAQENDGLDKDGAAKLDAAGLANDRGALIAWNNGMWERYKEPQPLILVTVSGGASASAVYCADVLFLLEEKYPGFSDRVRLVSGASGGMVGAAYFVTQLRPGGLIAEARKREEYQNYLAATKAARENPDDSAAKQRRDAAEKAYHEMMAGVRAEFFRGLEQDFLGPLVQKWVHRDMPLGAFARSTTNDRGMALEMAWKRHLNGALDLPFRDLRAEERAGKLPSLVFTPMMLEDGRQLIMSNLDLDYMVETARDGDKPLSYMGVEFFRMFPKADQFKLSTAVRMNASFPYFSPAAALPTDPVRHVVDAGYYDNYGTTVATKWINEHAEWLSGVGMKPNERPRPSEVILLRIRCFGNEDNSLQFVTEKELMKYARQTGRAPTPVNPVDRSKHFEILREAWSADANRQKPIRTEGGLFAVTSPLFGLFSSWRANMVYRADERLGGTINALAPRAGESGPLPPKARLSAYPITCQINPSLNWVLSAEDRAAIHRNVKVLEDLSRVESYLTKLSPDRPDMAAGTLTAELIDQAAKARRADPTGPAPRLTNILKQTDNYKNALPAKKAELEAQVGAAEKFGGFKLPPPVPKK